MCVKDARGPRLRHGSVKMEGADGVFPLSDRHCLDLLLLDAQTCSGFFGVFVPFGVFFPAAETTVACELILFLLLLF